ncbi:CPCC family cysteine-rich protein [Novosphingobium aquimarinum]|uniref:CPCC family cysteine-rich protein n=1 Tax=Novosphingobium aquimarinum TaxID=2682494 RepID=UPI0038CDA69B
MPKRTDISALHQCPCCYNRTLNERGSFEICPVCFWEDDGQDNHDAEVVRGGPNGGLSFTVARSNYQAIGACEQSAVDHVRAPTAFETDER